MAIREGDQAPAFTLPSSEGGEWSLEAQRGRKVVVYFYPKDSTPGCTTEAQDFRDARAMLEKHNALVVGISKDSIASHQKFCAAQSLNFPLLSDPEGKVLEAYGAWGEKKMYGKTSMGVIRSTVVVDEEGKIQKIFPKVRVQGHVAAVLQALASLG